MAKRWFGRVYLTGELIPSVCFQPFKMPENTSLRAVRVWLILLGTPVMTGLRASIYADQGGVPAGLIETSTNDWDTSDITSFAYAAREIYFEFDFRHLSAGTQYHLVLTADSYVGADASHIAWVHDFPNNVNVATTAGVPVSMTIKDLGRWPQSINFIGEEL